MDVKLAESIKNVSKVNATGLVIFIVNYNLFDRKLKYLPEILKREHNFPELFVKF